MRDFTQIEEDIDLLRSVRELLREARIHSDVTVNPLANFPLSEALRDLDSLLQPSDPFEIDTERLPAALDSAWHAMRATWSHSDVSVSPVLANRFHEGIRRIEMRLYGKSWVKPRADVISEADDDLQFG